MEAVVTIGRQLRFGLVEHRLARGAGAFPIHHIAGMPEDRARGVEIQQLLLEQGLLAVLPLDDADQRLRCFGRGYIRQLLGVLRHPFGFRYLRSQRRHKARGQHLVEVVAVLVQVLIVGVLRMVALVHPVDRVEELSFARAEGDELVALEELQVLQASLHQHHAVLGPLVFITAHQRDQPLLIFFAELGAVLRLIRLALHRV